MQTAEIRSISQKCKEKQDALEMKDKQVRVLLSVAFLGVLGFFVCSSVGRVAGFSEGAASACTLHSFQYTIDLLSVKQEFLRKRCILHKLSCLMK